MSFMEWDPTNTGADERRVGPFALGHRWTPTYAADKSQMAIQSAQEPRFLYVYNPGDPGPAPDEYHVIQRSYALTGGHGQIGATVNETRQWVPISIDDLLVRKQGELAQQTAFVMSANAQSSQVTNWVIVLDTVQRTWIASVINFLHDRLKRILIDGEQISYWARDVPIVIVNKLDDRRDRPNVTESQWSTVIKDIGLHDFDAVDANELVIADINAAYGDGTGTPGGPEWQTLAAIDVTEPAYGWPPVYDTNVNSTSFNGGGGD